MQPPDSTKPLLLYADDDPDDILLIHHTFRDNNIAVELVTVSDGMQALAFLESIPEGGRLPSLVLLDVNMPKLNGRDTLVRLREVKRLAAIPVMLFTTSSMELHRSFARRYNAGFMTKPLRDYQLQALVDKFLLINAAL
ncbi:MAG: response regulator [Chitinophagaceae bacterium]|nr:response regulator [Chitinophagaceae bacterium]